MSAGKDFRSFGARPGNRSSEKLARRARPLVEGLDMVFDSELPGDIPPDVLPCELLELGPSRGLGFTVLRFEELRRAEIEEGTENGVELLFRRSNRLATGFAGVAFYLSQVRAEEVLDDGADSHLLPVDSVDSETLRAGVRGDRAGHVQGFFLHGTLIVSPSKIGTRSGAGAWHSYPSLQ